MMKDGSTWSIKAESNKKWKTPKDFLEPQFYPDPLPFRASLEKMNKDDKELIRNLMNSKATLRVLAPYLKIMRKDKSRSIKEKPSKPKLEKIVMEKKSKELLTTALDLSEKAELVMSIHETADVIKFLLDAKFVVSYLVNATRNELQQMPRHVGSSITNLTWRIERGTTIATYAAHTKHYVVSNNVANDHRFPKGLGYPGSMPKFALCVPVKSTDEKVLVVYEIVRDAYDRSFSTKEIQMVLALAGWMGVGLMQNALYTTEVRRQELNEYLVSLTNHYHSGKVSIDSILNDLVTFARDTVGADRSNLYVVDKTLKGTVMMEEYEQGIDSARKLYKRRTKKLVSKDDTLLSKVIFNQEALHDSITVDIHVNDDNSVRSVLCAPITCMSETIGAIKLTNKKGALQFDDEDKEILETFASYCAINLNHLKLHEKFKQTELQNKVFNEMLFHHIKPCSHDRDAVKAYGDLPEDFFNLDWYPAPDEIPKLLEYSIIMFQEVLGDSFMALNNIPKFVLTVRNCYRPNPYHNFLHAFNVFHSMGNIISRYHNIFTGVERKSLMIAALCHDVDHRGYNNNFVQLTRHHLATLYDTSPLENHHFAVTKLILQQCSMFNYMKTDNYNEIIEEIYHDIIATDLSLYFQSRMELLSIADKKTFTFKNLAHRRLVKSLMMTACDLSGQTKPMHISQKITEDVYEEFFQQGDVEKRMGYVPLPTMDRNKKDLIAENQVQFLSVVVLPCVETVSRIFGSLSPIVRDCKVLLKQWKELVELKDQVTWKPAESLVNTKPNT